MSAQVISLCTPKSHMTTMLDTVFWYVVPEVSEGPAAFIISIALASK